MDSGAAEDYFDYSNMNDHVQGILMDKKNNNKGGGKADANDDGGGGMITKLLLGVWNETFNSTCQCFDQLW